MLASLAWRANIGLQGILSAACWSNHTTFTSFNLKDLKDELHSLGPLVDAQRVISLQINYLHLFLFMALFIYSTLSENCLQGETLCSSYGGEDSELSHYGSFYTWAGTQAIWLRWCQSWKGGQAAGKSILNAKSTPEWSRHDHWVTQQDQQTQMASTDPDLHFKPTWHSTGCWDLAMQAALMVSTTLILHSIHWKISSHDHTAKSANRSSVSLVLLYE